MTHQCGTCVKCCELMPVAEINKPGYTKCKHQGVFPPLTPGCTIYANRPSVCRVWSCWWLESEGWPDELKPERCGVVFDGTQQTVTVDGIEYKTASAWVAPGYEWAFRDDPHVQKVIAVMPDGYVMLWHLPDYTLILRMKGNTLICSEPHPRAPTPGMKPLLDAIDTAIYTNERRDDI